MSETLSCNPPLKTPTRNALELLARLAAKLLDAPVGFIALQSCTGAWCNITYGLSADWQARELPDSAAVLAADGLFTRQYQAGSHPLTGTRFLAALPLSNGVTGLIGILDGRCRELRAAETAKFEGLRALVLEAIRSTTPAKSSSAEETIAFTLDLRGRFTSVRGEIPNAGYSEGDLIGADILDLVPPQHRESTRDRLLAELGGGGEGSFDLNLKSKTGDSILLAFRTRLLFVHGQPSGIEASCRDITAARSLDVLRRDAEARLEERSREFARLNEYVGELRRISAISHSDIESMCAEYLAAGCSMLGLPAGLVTSEIGAVLASIPSKFSSGFRSVISIPLVYGHASFGAIQFGSFAESGAAAPDAPNEGLVDLLARNLGHALFSDRLLREQSALKRQLARQLRQDSLTGLPNRLGLGEWLEETIVAASSTRQQIAVVYLDIDQFKQINDTLGHSAGDDLLCEVAGRLQQLIRPQEFIARMGGDEFSMILSVNSSEGEILSRLRRILAGIRAPFMINDYELFVTASFGISVFPRDGGDVTTLLQRADAAMFRAKSNGKNDYQFFRPEMAARAMNRLDLEIQLRRAIENDELGVRFQPILTIDRKLQGAEALLAWNNPKFGSVGPGRFIPIAEESGMIVSIGRWVLREACAQNVAWQKAGYTPLRVSVNVSALQFARPDFIGMVSGVLKETGMPPQCLELELTESIVMRDTEECTRRLLRLRELGISLSIDDFGTGYSSLSYLRRLPVDSLKIDQSFLRDLSSSTSSLPVIQTIVVLAHNMGLSVVAEGVETEEQFDVLRAIGCDRVQGHLFGEPLRPDCLPAFMTRSSNQID